MQLLGSAVKLAPRRLDAVAVADSKGSERAHAVDEVHAQLRQFVLDPRRDNRKDLAPHKAIAFEDAQRPPRHFRGDAFELARQFTVAHPTRRNAQTTR